MNIQHTALVTRSGRQVGIVDDSRDAIFMQHACQREAAHSGANDRNHVVPFNGPRKCALPHETDYGNAVLKLRAGLSIRIGASASGKKQPQD
jgi:hypothetical protein